MPRKRLIVPMLIAVLLLSSCSALPNAGKSLFAEPTPTPMPQIAACYIQYEFADEKEFVDAVANAKQKHKEGTWNSYVSNGYRVSRSNNIETVNKYFRFSDIPEGYCLKKISTMDTSVFIHYWLAKAQQESYAEPFTLHYYKYNGWDFLNPSREYRRLVDDGKEYVFDDALLMLYFEVDGVILQMSHPARKADEDLIALAKLVERVDVD